MALGDKAMIPAPFDTLERAAIAIGRRDRLPLFARNGRVARLLGAIFGIAPAQPLANPRLEALRLLVIALRRSGRDGEAAVAAARAAGLPAAQVARLLNEFGCA